MVRIQLIKPNENITLNISESIYDYIISKGIIKNTIKTYNMIRFLARIEDDFKLLYELRKNTTIKIKEDTSTDDNGVI